MTREEDDYSLPHYSEDRMQTSQGLCGQELEAICKNVARKYLKSEKFKMTSADVIKEESTEKKLPGVLGCSLLLLRAWVPGAALFWCSFL